MTTAPGRRTRDAVYSRRQGTGATPSTHLVHRCLAGDAVDVPKEQQVQRLLLGFGFVHAQVLQVQVTVSVVHELRVQGSG